jgi:hypothetical protein
MELPCQQAFEAGDAIARETFQVPMGLALRVTLSLLLLAEAKQFRI